MANRYIRLISSGSTLDFKFKAVQWKPIYQKAEQVEEYARPAENITCAHDWGTGMILAERVLEAAVNPVNVNENLKWVICIDVSRHSGWCLPDNEIPGPREFQYSCGAFVREEKLLLYLPTEVLAKKGGNVIPAPGKMTSQVERIIDAHPGNGGNHVRNPVAPGILKRLIGTGHVPGLWRWGICPGMGDDSGLRDDYLDGIGESVCREIQGDTSDGIILDVHLFWGLRIVYSMRYTDLNNGISPHKTVRTGVGPSYTHLTQPTEWTADWADDYYISLFFLRPGGIHQGVFVWHAGSLRERPKGGIKMLTQTQLVPTEMIQLAMVPRQQVVEVLKNFRKEWQRTVSEQSLLDTYAPVALFIVDMIHGLDISRSEAMDILGFSLWAECTNQVGEVGRV